MEMDLDMDMDMDMDLEIERAGSYRFELRRWPRESGLKLTEACTATQFVDGEGDANRDRRHQQHGRDVVEERR